MILPCPSCGGDGDVIVQVWTEVDGDGPWATPVTRAAFFDNSCACELTEAQIADLERRAVEYAAEAGAPDV